MIISQSFPTEVELQLTDSLESFLRKMNLYPTSDRQMIIYKLGNLLNSLNGLLYTFGSFRLGVYSDTSDIDSLLICSSQFTRDQIKDKIVELLSSSPDVSEIAAVDQAYVPVVNFIFNQIPIDLVYCRLNMPVLQEPLKTDENSILLGLDEHSIRSLNGHRVTDMILSLVPNVEQFRIALRAIKLWAKRKGIYGNVMGFFGGVAWAMCVAKICQLYPNTTASVLVCKFFKVFYQWRWPSPVTLKEIQDYTTSTNFDGNASHPNLNMRVWNPAIYPSDRAHRMPVITPAYPSMCATHNVTLSTQLIMTEEFKNSADMAEKLLSDPQACLEESLDSLNKSSSSSAISWHKLFSPNDFYSRYKYYLCVIAVSYNPDDHLIWSGMVESRIRQLVAKLELVDCLHLAHPHTKTVERIIVNATEKDIRDVDNGRFDSYFDKMRITDQARQTNAMDVDETKNTKAVYTTSFYIGLSVNQDRKSKKLDISWPISDFTQMCHGWDKYVEGSMSLSVHHVKSSHLHPDVYDKAGSQQQTEKKKKQIDKKLKEPPLKKRKQSNEQIEDSPLEELKSSNEDISNETADRHVPSARTHNIRQTILKYVNDAQKPSRT